MIRFAPRAIRHIDELTAHYPHRNRPEALVNLRRAIGEAIDRIQSDPAAGLPAPRPHPDIAEPGRLWIFCRQRYWIGYRLGSPPVIVAVVYDQADIPRRL